MKFLLILACVPLFCPAQLRPVVPETVRPVLFWLPADTESIRVASQPFVYPRLPKEEGALDPRVAGPPNLLVLLPILAVETLEKAKGIEDLFAERRVAFAIDARRHLQGGPYGVIRSESCTLAVFEKSLTLDPFLKRGTAEQVGRQRVASFASTEKEISRLWVALPWPNLVIGCSDRSFMQTLLQRLEREDGVRALPDTLPEWKYVTGNAPFWSLRHYGARKPDPHMPFGVENPGPVEGDPNAVGMVMQYQPDQEKALSFTYLTSSADVRSAVRMSMFDFDSPLVDPDTEVRQVGPGAVTTRTGMSLVEGGWGLALLFQMLGAI